jgi:probable HAF family extracellular repeat protein
MTGVGIRRGALAVALIAAAALAPAARASPSYSITIIPLPANAASLTPTALNNNGQVTGSLQFQGQSSHAFLYSGGVVTDLGTLLYPGSVIQGNATGQAINDAGVIVGTFSDPVSDSWSYGFVSSSGSLTALNGSSGYTNCTATGINTSSNSNASSLIVGGCSNPTLNTAFSAVYSSSGTPQGVGPTGGSAYGVNAYGQVAAVGSSSGFIYDSNGATVTTISPVETTSAPMPANPTAINNAGEVVGWQGSGTSYVGFLYQNVQKGTSTELPFPLSTTPPVLSINNAGQIVGSAATTSGAMLPYLTVGGALTNVNALISTTDPNQRYITFVNAYAINDSGQILAAGVDSRTGLTGAYLLTPTTAWPANVTLAASVSTVVAGTAFTLWWIDQTVTSCTASGGSGSDGWQGNVAINGGQMQITESTAGSYSYTLTCATSFGSVASTATVTVSKKSSGGSSSGGGGALDGALLAVLLALAALRVRPRA